MANREKRGDYPEPSRDLNNRRFYTVEDVLLHQIISFKQTDPRAIVDMLYDKGIGLNDVQVIMDNALKKITAK